MIHTSKIEFAMAYRAWLERAGPTTGPEPLEPSAAGLASDPDVAASIGEAIARAVHSDWERARIERAQARARERAT